MSGWLAVLCALGSATFFSLSSALKHRSAAAPSGDDRASVPVTALLRGMVGHRLWRAGIATDVGGLGLQVVGLHLGGLVLVQPILVTAVAGSIVASAWLERRQPTRQQLGWALVLVVALGVFLIPLQVRGELRPVSADRAPGYVLGGFGAGAVLLAVTLGRLRGSGRLAAGSLGTATGLLYAGAAALITVIGVQVTRGGIGAVLTSSEIYVLIVLGAVSQVVSQAAFAASGLGASVPIATVVDLLASVVLGVAVFDHPLPHDALALGLAVAALLVACRATLALGALSTDGDSAASEANPRLLCLARRLKLNACPPVPESAKPRGPSRSVR